MKEEPKLVVMSDFEMELLQQKAADKALKEARHKKKAAAEAKE